ncbi:CC124 protein, partial [Columbina picui]|nr:CC124 protein [Columbina picui]
KAAADAKRQQELEDAYWKDEDKHVMRKEQRKVNSWAGRRGCSIWSLRSRLAQQGASPPLALSLGLILGLVSGRKPGTMEKEKTHLEVPLEENINRRALEEGSVEARTIEDAIAVLSVTTDLDRHPERRMKAAFTAFEELNLPRLKQENPNMRLSQLKQLLKKEWMKSPENPMNQRHKAYNSQK